MANKSGVGNSRGFVVLYRQYDENSKLEEYDIDCSIYGVDGEGISYIDNIVKQKYERISALFEHDGVKEAADIGGIRIYLEYNSDRKCMELSDEYVFDGYDTRKLPGQDINLNDCEVVTGERDDIRELTRARYQLDSYGDWEAFAVKIDNHWRLGYYKDGVAVIIYYETGAYVERSSGGNYEGRVCLVARVEKSSDSEAESLVFGGYQVENLGIDYAIMGIMELTQNGEEEQLMVGRLYDDEIIQYNVIELKK